MGRYDGLRAQLIDAATSSAVLGLDSARKSTARGNRHHYSDTIVWTSGGGGCPSLDGDHGGFILAGDRQIYVPEREYAHSGRQDPSPPVRRWTMWTTLNTPGTRSEAFWVTSGIEIVSIADMAGQD